VMQKSRVLSCFDKLSMIGKKPFALSLSKGAPRTSRCIWPSNGFPCKSRAHCGLDRRHPLKPFTLSLSKGARPGGRVQGWGSLAIRDAGGAITPFY
jgi:hypothetical protein